jgi:hypothetical protein
LTLTVILIIRRYLGCGHDVVEKNGEEVGNQRSATGELNFSGCFSPTSLSVLPGQARGWGFALLEKTGIHPARMTMKDSG